jgi:hypothetical protein
MSCRYLDLKAASDGKADQARWLPRSFVDARNLGRIDFWAVGEFEWIGRIWAKGKGAALLGGGCELDGSLECLMERIF